MAPGEPQTFTAGCYGCGTNYSFLNILTKHECLLSCVLSLVCKFLDRNARGHSSSSTEAGSALGPDWHEGLSLWGAEQVRLFTLLVLDGPLATRKVRFLIKL